MPCCAFTSLKNYGSKFLPTQLCSDICICIMTPCFVLQLSSVQTQMHSKGGYSGEEETQGTTPGGIDVRNQVRHACIHSGLF